MKKIITRNGMLLDYFYNFSNTDLKMKLTVFLLVVSLFELQANPYSENTTLSLNVKSANELPDKMDCKPSDGLLFLTKIDTPPPPYKTSQERVVKGVITDEDDNPLPGANIIVKGTTIGVTSDFDGKYSISIPQNVTTLVFSYIGYQTQEVAVNGRETINIQLISSMDRLDEIVVVGYGVQKRETITGAVSSVQGADLVKSPVLNLTNTLAGRIAGLFVTQASAEPGNDNSSIRIRGTNTFNNTGALIVIDGVPGRAGGLSRINSADIENISVLKDASAAIYGARAANGVILVTTKRGRKGKPKLSYSFNQGWAQPVSIARLTDAKQYAGLINELSVYELDSNQWKAASDAYSTGEGLYTRPDGSTKNAPFTQKDLEFFGNGDDPWGHPNTDWFGETFKTWSPQAKHTLQLTGGTEKIIYYASLGYQDQDAYYKNSATGYKQYDFRLNLDTEISDYIKVSVGVLGRQEFRFYPTKSAGSIFRMLLRSKPTKPAYWPNGLPGPDIENGENPVSITTNDTGYDKDKRDFFQSNASLDIKVPGIEGLSFKGTAAIDKNFRNTKRWVIPWFLYTWDGSTYVSDKVPKLVKGKRGPAEPRLNQQTFNTLDVLLGASAKYEHTFFGDHNVEVLAGVNRETQYSENFRAYRRFFISNALDQLFAGGDEEKDNGGGASEKARLNYYGRVLYNYQEKYLVEFLGRYDGSYLFPKDTRFDLFPGVSAGWVVSKEEFFDEVPFIDFLKIRGSWGQLGNDDVPRFQYLATYGFGSYIINNTPVTIINESRVPDTSITWEVATNSNFGIEARFLDRRLHLEFDYFFNKRTDILTRPSASIPDYSGISASNQNIGEVENKGVDLLIGYNDQIGDISFGATLTAGYARNKLVFKDEAEGSPEWQRETGKPIRTRLVYGYDGVFATQADIDAETLDYSALTNKLRPGDMKFVDYDGDGAITPKDKYRTDKNNDPRLTYGVNIIASYKNFDLSMLLQGAGGSEILLNSAGGDFGNYPSYIYENRWTVNNQSSVDPRIADRAELYFSGGNTYWIQSTNYVRLKNIELGYTLPKEISNKFGIINLRFYASGLNLFTITDSFFDPESTRADGNYYPNPRIINTGFSFSF